MPEGAQIVRRKPAGASQFGWRFAGHGITLSSAIALMGAVARQAESSADGSDNAHRRRAIEAAGNTIIIR
jgi:hypothetical protein